MIQEILDYCLIKSQLLEFSKEEIMSQFDTATKYGAWIEVLYFLSMDDDFLISDDLVFKKARDIVREMRFEYKEKNIGNLSNGLIEYFNVYDSLPEAVITELKAEWGAKEAKLHNLPSGEYKIEELLEYIKYDHYYISYLFSDTMEVRVNPSHVVSSISYLINKCPNIFEMLKKEEDSSVEESFYKAISLIEFCTKIESTATRKTRKRAKNLLENMLAMDESFVGKKSCQLKLRKNNNQKKTN